MSTIIVIYSIISELKYCIFACSFFLALIQHYETGGKESVFSVVFSFQDV